MLDIYIYIYIYIYIGYKAGRKRNFVIKKKSCTRPDFATAVLTKIQAIWEITPCILIGT